MNIRKLKPVGVEIRDIDLASATEYEISEISKLLTQELIVLIRSQDHLSLDRFSTINKVWGRHEHTDLWCRHERYPLVMRVTNKKVDGDRAGLFPNGEMQWHTNGPLMAHPEEALVLWCIDPGHSSTTSFLDCAKAYDELSDPQKKRCQNVLLWLTNKYQKTVLKKPVCSIGDKAALIELEKHRTRHDHDIFAGRDLRRPEDIPSVSIIKNLVVRQPVSGRVGLYFPYFYVEKLQSPHLSNLQELNFFHDLVEHLTKEDRFVYHHQWQKGDMVLADQTLTLHKRSCHQGVRELFRTVFWYNRASL